MTEPKPPKPSDDRRSGDGTEVLFPWQPGYQEWCAGLASEKAARRAAADARLAAKEAAASKQQPERDEPPPAKP